MKKKNQVDMFELGFEAGQQYVLDEHFRASIENKTWIFLKRFDDTEFIKGFYVGIESFC